MKRYTLPTGDIVYADDQFVIGNQTYPAGWLRTATDQEIASASIAVDEVPDPEPDLMPPTEPNTKVDGLVFMKRVRPEEYVAIKRAAQASLMSDPPQPELSMWLDMLQINGEIDLAGEDALAAKAFLVQCGLLSESRADQIFSLP